MDANTIIEILVGMVVAGLGFWNNKQASDITELQKSLVDVKVNYVHKNDVKDLKESIEKRFDKLEAVVIDAVRGTHDYKRND